MICSHEKLRCTNNVFYCLTCGARVPEPHAGKAPEQAKATQEEPKKTGKRKAKKEEQV